MRYFDPFVDASGMEFVLAGFTSQIGEGMVGYVKQRVANRA